MKAPPRQIIWCLGFLALICMVLYGACALFNNDPIISSLEAERDLVAPSSSSEIKCVASDADGDRLAYTWSATGGAFLEQVRSLLGWHQVHLVCMQSQLW